MSQRSAPPGAHDLDSSRLILTPEGRAVTKAVEENFYESLSASFGDFAGHMLVAEHECTAPWDAWEMHPHGDEMVYLLRGEVNFVLWMDNSEQIVRLSRPGTYVVVPKGVWHTAKPAAPSKLLFITPGEDTRHGTPPGLGGR